VSQVGNFFFAVMALVSVLGAVVTVMARSPIRSAVGLLASIVGIAGLFLKLNAQFLSAIQLIVYAGAVVVLFVFVIMLLGPDAGAAAGGLPKTRLSRVVAGICIVVGAVAAFGLAGSVTKPTPFALVPAEHGSLELVGRELFTQAIVPFELSTALLIVAVVGAIAVARSHPSPKAKLGAGKAATQRLFHGPLHPRDAGRPLQKESA
jgi:NADH-quinone oxidoreductase subunit J